METAYHLIRNKVSSAILDAGSACGYELEQEEVSASVLFSDKFTDISSTIAMKLGKKLGVEPEEVAKKMIGRISVEGIERVAFENGFINFYIKRENFSRKVLDEMMGSRWKAAQTGKRGRVIVEYPSVNPAHPLHIGHVRSALLGDSISNILVSCGYEIEREDYIDDLGLQAAEALWGVMNRERIGIAFNPSKKYDHMLGEIYVAVNRKLKEDESLMEEIKRTSELMEESGTYESLLLQDMVESFLKSEYQTLFRLGVFHDIMVWESTIIYNKLLEKAIQKLDSEKILARPKDGKYGGCVVIDTKRLKGAPQSMMEVKETEKVLVRSNGVPGYLSKDLAFHMWKFGMLDVNVRFKKFMEQPNGKTVYSSSKDGEQMDFGRAVMAVNPIDARQSYEQELVGLIIRNASAVEHRLVHMPYGVVELESGALSGRKGSWIGFTADDLINEAVMKAETLVSSRKEIDTVERKKIAEAVAIAAIRFEFLKISYEKKIVFSWERALNFEGNSGPYCQYMYTRAGRIISSVHEEPEISEEYKVSDVEFELIKKMAAYWEQVSKAGDEMKPHIVAVYLNELCALFGKFYEAKQVAKADNKMDMRARLAIVRGFYELAGWLMDILGIKRLEAM